jgi:glucose-6-phosphate dehydrogenase assembly protein OpcA
VAPAVTAAVKPAWRGTDVTVGQILDKLKELRDAGARKEIGDADHLSPRNSVLDVIIVASEMAAAERAAGALESLAMHHPCRAVVVVDSAGSRQSRIDATVKAVSHPRPGGAVTIHEQVFLQVSGPVAGHIGSLVDSLLLADVATYVWWTGSPPVGLPRFASALEAADVLLVDSSRFEQPHEQFSRLAEASAAAAAGKVFGDLHWARLQPWREVLAQFFNPVDRRGFLRGIGAVGIDYVAEGRGNRSAAALLAGWLGSALGWRLKSSAAGSDEMLAANLVSPGGHPVELALRSVALAGFAPGEISAVRVEAVFSGQTCSIRAVRDDADNGHVVLEGDLRGIPLPRLVLPVPARADADLLGRLLVDARSDRAYPRALQLGAEILRSAGS